jgi:hypothetical protein
LSEALIQRGIVALAQDGEVARDDDVLQDTRRAVL